MKMKPSLIANVSLYARTLQYYKLSTGFQLADSIRPRLSFYSTQSQSNDEDADHDVSNEELKRKIDNYYHGNDEALPEIFQAILKRKLTGKHEQNDKELMEEICGKREEPLSDDDDEEDERDDSESDFDEFYGSDEKAADLHDAMDKLVKELPINKRAN